MSDKMITRRRKLPATWILFLAWLAMLTCSSRAAAQSMEVCRSGKPTARLICPNLAGPTTDIVSNTLNGCLQRFYGWQLPIAQDLQQAGTYVIAGTPENNKALRQLEARGLRLDDTALGDEGFRIFTHEIDQRQLIILHAKTPLGLKHACQELVYFQLAVTTDVARLPWPLDITMKPAVPYRACYMLPCWSAYDSLESWQTTLDFNSELTLNRNWFWLNGFPLLPQYGGLYQGSDLSELKNVRSLVDRCHSQGMKFYIGGGWFTWHHKESSSGSASERVARVGAGGGEAPLAPDEKSLANGIQYYLDLLKALPEADGIYLEPTGEGAQADASVWNKHATALGELLKDIHSSRPEFEAAIAIGRFNAPEYRQAIHQLAPNKMHWFWAWGNPLEDRALLEHPLVLRWHTTQTMSSFHGSSQPPQPRESRLAGQVTSWDPGMGFGNPWNGWAKIGVDRARNFDPYTMPYFSHQYWFRERCWNLELTEQQFAARLSKRLFDADMPEESVHHYLKLAAMCPDPQRADREVLNQIKLFLQPYAAHGTSRNRDTLRRMQEAIAGVEASRR